MEQLVFPLKKITRYTEADFVVTSSNHIAHAYVMSWPSWPALGGIIVGPAYSGKTHLCHLWQKKVEALWLTADTIKTLDFEKMGATSVIIEDVDHLLPEHEVALFHLFNHIKSEKGSLLMTSTKHPKFWTTGLKDLVSRFSSLPVFEIQAPDDTLFLAILTKSFADYQLHVPFKVLDFILKQVPRTFDSLKEIPQQLNDMSLQKKSPITIPFVKETLNL